MASLRELSIIFILFLSACGDPGRDGLTTIEFYTYPEVTALNLTGIGVDPDVYGRYDVGEVYLASPGKGRIVWWTSSAVRNATVELLPGSPGESKPHDLFRPQKDGKEGGSSHHIFVFAEGGFTMEIQ